LAEGWAPTFAGVELYFLKTRVMSLCRYHRVFLQRKKCCQQIIRFDDESFSVAVRIDAKK